MADTIREHADKVLGAKAGKGKDNPKANGAAPQRPEPAPAPSTPPPDEPIADGDGLPLTVDYDDFYGYSPKGNFIFTLTGELWPSEVVNRRRHGRTTATAPRRHRRRGSHAIIRSSKCHGHRARRN